MNITKTATKKTSKKTATNAAASSIVLDRALLTRENVEEMHAEVERRFAAGLDVPERFLRVKSDGKPFSVGQLLNQIGIAEEGARKKADKEARNAAAAAPVSKTVKPVVKAAAKTAAPARDVAAVKAQRATPHKVTTATPPRPLSVLAGLKVTDLSDAELAYVANERGYVLQPLGELAKIDAAVNPTGKSIPAAAPVKATKTKTVAAPAPAAKTPVKAAKTKTAAPATTDDEVIGAIVGKKNKTFVNVETGESYVAPWKSWKLVAERAVAIRETTGTFKVDNAGFTVTTAEGEVLRYDVA